MRQMDKITPVLLGFLLFCCLAGPSQAESLFEQYSQKNAIDLNAETQAMGRQLKTCFSAENIARKQQQIDFSEYRSNLKKSLLYADSLATYSQYETDLEFARDKEMFKGLPEEASDDAQTSAEAQERRKDFMQKKYQRMQQNVEGEIATYSDLLLLSLETCETLTRQDFSGIQDDASFREEMRDFLGSEEVSHFQARQAELMRRWPAIGQRIAAQMDVWRKPPLKPNAPIIDPQIIGDLS